MFQSKILEKLIDELKKLPGVGRKSAMRIAFHMLRSPTEDVESLASILREVKERVRRCNTCGNYTEDETCELCRDPRRDPAKLCVVEQPGDVFLIESTGEFRGVYHVLHGALSPLEGVRPEMLRIDDLIDRIGKSDIEEVILATNPTVEGDATAFYIAGALEDLEVQVSRIARGVPVGGELEFSDPMTLGRALKGRRGLE